MKYIFLMVVFLFVGCSSNKYVLHGVVEGSTNQHEMNEFVSTLKSNDLSDARKYIEENNFDINFVNNNKLSLLVLSILNENHKVAKALLELGADPNAKGSSYEGISAMGLAASYKNSSFLTLLLEYDADPNYVLNQSSLNPSPIFDALSADRVQNFKVMIEVGANLDQKNRFGNTVAKVAAGRGDWEALYFLLNAGSDPFLKNNFNKTIVDTIEIQGLGEDSPWREKVFEFYLDRGVKIKDIYK
ncbi:ankyrin repeat domain-containing protein [Marinomonas sp. PE14-40]|uniref:ankyrin repeat domain-containing protein n=1 Tax=Marinomonas sp. PE14-40 TaxID=3060621 RepID=UPI003F67073A